MARFYMITNHPRYGIERTELKDVSTWHEAVDKALLEMTAAIMHTLKGIEIKTE